MNTAWLDCFSGISGNMFLGAVIDAGASAAKIRKMVKGVVPDFTLSVKDASRAHIGGKHVVVKYKKKDQPHRHLPDIEKMIKRGGLPDAVRDNSLAVFRALAEAEARVHRTTPEKIHFHEVGAVDAIVDVVGTAAGLYLIGIKELICSPLPLSFGEVECAHGTLPLPAPAVMEILAGAPVRGVDTGSELVTPTGAALVKTLSTGFGPMPPMKVQRTGAGLGDREIKGRPNLARLVVGVPISGVSAAVQVEAAIDDMPGEHYEYLMERLHAAGALEVVFVPVQMKKNRPGVLVRALASPEVVVAVKEAMLEHSTSLGVREYEVGRTILPRKSVTIKTRYGNIRVKVAERPKGSDRFHVEYDDLKRAAEKCGKPIDEVEREVYSSLSIKSGDR